MITKILILLGMIWLHIIDDYTLQGILASMKQKQWWVKNYPDELYKNDYKIALLTHAFSWAFMIMLIPNLIALYKNELTYWYIITLIINWLIHAYVDNLKANKLKINLIHDQIIHITQIIITWFMLVV